VEPPLQAILTFSAYNPAFSGGEEDVSYTVQPGDDLVAVASGLATALNSDSVLSSVQIDVVLEVGFVAEN